MNLIYSKERRYTLIEESKIETAFGGLYKALDLEFGRNVAVKSTVIPGENFSQKQNNLKTANKEVAAMIKAGDKTLKTPRILDTYYDKKSSVFYIIMEWVSGQTLTSFMKAPEKKFISWMIDLCSILEEMQRQNPRIYHKDIKPDNIMIRNDAEKTLMLIDFNISISEPNKQEGTLHYKAPEMTPLITSMDRSRVDIFAIGVILYEYYTGNVPIMGEDYSRNRLRGPVEWDDFTEPKQKNPAINEKINSIIVKCMRLDPAKRYSNISELKQALISAGKR